LNRFQVSQIDIFVICCVLQPWGNRCCTSQITPI